MPMRPHHSAPPHRPLASLARAALLASVAVAGVAPAAVAQDTTHHDDPTRSLGTGRVVAQVATGVALAPVGFVGGGLTTRWVAKRFGAGEERAATVGYVGAWSGALFATAAGPALIGARGPGVGHYPAAVGGAAVGGLLSWAIIRLNKRGSGEGESRPCRVVCVISTVAIATLPSIGATIAYNSSRHSAQ